MYIYRDEATGLYHCDHVFVTVRGRCYLVGIEYVGVTRMEVIRQVVGNAWFKRARLNLAYCMTVER